jgi:hypothetical protein
MSSDVLISAPGRTKKARQILFCKTPIMAANPCFYAVIGGEEGENRKGNSMK